MADRQPTEATVRSRSPTRPLQPPCFFCHRRQANVSVMVPIDQKSTNMTAALNSLTPPVIVPPSDV